MSIYFVLKRIDYWSMFLQQHISEQILSCNVTLLINKDYGGGWMICHFLIISVHFVFCSLNFIVLFPFLIKFYQIMFVIIVFRLGCYRPSGLLLFVPAVLFSMLTPLFCVSSSVSLSYFVLAVPMRECLGKHSCMSSPFPINHTEWYFLISLFGAREYKHAHRTLLQALFLKWPLKTI